jgi:hypothetical protein
MRRQMTVSNRPHRQLARFGGPFRKTPGDVIGGSSPLLTGVRTAFKILSKASVGKPLDRSDIISQVRKHKMGRVI